MSTGLMSCVRENSPPLEMADSESGALSLPPNTSDQQKRRRFHPLRNLRRIFRRRSLANADATTATPSPSSSSSQMSSSPTVIAAAPAQTTSSPSATSGIATTAATASSTAYYKQQQHSSPVDVTTMSSTTTYPSHMIGLTSGSGHGISSCGVAIIQPFNSSTSASSGFYIKESREYSGDGLKLNVKEETSCDLSDNREMTDYQRSFSEGRLVESEFNRDVLSQSHDSVFSESATASSLSIVLKAELFDVLRKRRNRPDASDEDLGLPRSPTTPQRKEHTINQSEGSLSLLSMASSDMDDESTSNYGIGDKTSSSISSKQSQDASKTSDEIDLDISVGSRLSHSAARHKMAVRPKKKGPTRHRRPIESSVLPSTPEVNEDVFKLTGIDVKDFYPDKTKSHSLPPAVNNKTVEQHSIRMTKDTTSNIQRSKTETTSITTSMYANKKFAKSTDIVKEQQISTSSNSTLERKDDEGGFFKRLLHRNSKKNKKTDDETDKFDASNNQITEQSQSIDRSEVISHKLEETRMEIRKEIMSEAKSGLSAILNSFILSSDHEKLPEPANLPKPQKAKSGAAARQRVVPKDLTTSPVLERKKVESNVCKQFIEKERTVEYANLNRQRYPVILTAGPPSTNTTINDGSKLSLNLNDSNEDVFYDSPQQQDRKDDKKTISKVASEEIIIPKVKKRSIEEQSHSVSPPKDIWNDRYEKKDRVQPKVVGLSAFQHKMSKIESSNVDRPAPKPRKIVEKSKSFRYYSDSTDDNENKNLKRSENMPSLPDLTQPRGSFDEKNLSPDSEPLSMGFEINDNNLIKLRRHDEEALPLSHGIYTKNIILTTSKASQSHSTKSIAGQCNQNITEIEENIDKLVKSPFVTVLKKSSNSPEPIDTVIKSISNNTNNISITSIRKTETFEKREITENLQSPKIVADITIGENKAFMEKTTTIEKTTESRDNEKSKLISTSTVSTISLDKAKINAEEKLKPLTIERRTSTESTDSKDKSATPTKSRRSSSIFEKSTEQVPEFMKIQLNRVDSGRPKSNIVLSKNTKDTDNQEVTRRFSNENVEITDNKPPLPPDVTVKRSSITSVTKTPEQERPKSPIKKIVDTDNNILRNTENTQLNNINAERRKSVVSDEKLKYEKKIEDLKSERKKSASDDARIDSRKSSIEDETGVVLRKKSFASNNKEDTPELMKVFARRSLKIKDTDETQSFDDIEKTTNSLKRAANLDSDKENQSSSEEKLDKLPKVEITIQPSKTSIQNGIGIKNDDKNRNSISDIVYRKPTTTILSTTSTITPKPYVPPTRFGNVTNYRSTTAFIETRKTVQQSIISPAPTSPKITTNLGQQQTSEQNNNNTNNNNNNNSSNLNSNLKGNSIRNTIGVTTAPITTTGTAPTETREESEFKGILQRRAEWEKRAKEASSK